MKKIIIVLALLLNVAVFAQDKINEGVITTKQTLSSSNEQMMAQFAMIGDMITTTHFNGNKSHSEMSNPMTGNSITIMDNDKKEMLVMMDNPMMGKKYMLKSTEPSEEDLQNITIIKGEETKTVLGYDCDQYNVTLKKDGVVVEMVLYTTENIGAVSQQSYTLAGQLKGFPMYMEMNMNQMGMDMKIIHEVTALKSETVSVDKFDMTPLEGYEKTDKMQGM